MLPHYYSKARSLKLIISYTFHGIKWTQNDDVLLLSMGSYNEIRQKYRPNHIQVLLIAESPPPAAGVASSRHFYRSDQIRREDRLFANTVRALYPEAEQVPEPELEHAKEQWLRKFQADGWYMIEALEKSMPHEATKQQRQAFIKENLPQLLEHVTGLTNKNTKIILIKSNVFDVAAEPLRQAGFTVLNTELIDYPGRFNQSAYRQKLSKLAAQANQ